MSQLIITKTSSRCIGQGTISQEGTRAHIHVSSSPRLVVWKGFNAPNLQIWCIHPKFTFVKRRIIKVIIPLILLPTNFAPGDGCLLSRRGIRAKSM